jgi:hypothetical protein
MTHLQPYYFPAHLVRFIIYMQQTKATGWLATTVCSATWIEGIASLDVSEHGNSSV